MLRPLAGVVLVFATFGAPERAAACTAPVATSLTPTDSTLADWSSSTLCMWQGVDATNDQTTAGVDILGYGVTHTTNVADLPNHFWFIRLRGAPVNNRTYRIEFNGPGGVVDMNMTCPNAPTNGPRTCSVACTLDGNAATCANNTIRAYPLANGEWAIELARQSTQLFFDVVDGSSFAAYTLNGNTVLDSTTPVTGYSSTGFASALLVHLTAFLACPSSQGSEIYWRTAAERDTVGFLVHRDAPQGPLVDAALIPGALASALGASYTLFDADASAGASYYLEEVTTRGARSYGPSRPSTRCSTAPPAAAPAPAVSALTAAIGGAGSASVAPCSGNGGDDLYTDLAAPGAYLVPAAWGRAATVSHDGAALPLGAGDSATQSFFLAAAPLAFDRANDAYHLERRVGTVMASRSALGAAAPAYTAVTTFTAAEHHIINASAPAALRFVWTYAFSGASAARVTVPLPRYAGGDVQLRISVSGMSEFHLPLEHHARVFVQGSNVAEFTFGGHGEVVFDATVAAAAVSGTELVLDLQAVSDLGAPYDIIGLNFVQARYVRELVADHDVLTFDADAALGLELSGFSATPVVLDITDPMAPVRISAPSLVNGELGRIRFADDAGRRSYFVGVPQALPNVRPATHLETAAADYVVIYADGMGQALAPLLDWRRAHGRAVLAASMTEVADAYSFGQRSPVAVRRFVADMRERGVQDVLLVGSASLDPRNVLQQSKRDLVPTHIGAARPFNTYAADDGWFVREEGRFAAFASVGRLPVRDSTELGLIVDKVLRYEKATPGQSAVLVADALDPESGQVDGNFVAESEQLALALSRFALTRVYQPQAGHAELMAAFADAPDLVVYNGHGSGNTWSTAELLSSAPDRDQLASMPPVNPFLLITRSCWDGQFALPQGDSLSQSLVLLPQGGAIAALAASSLTSELAGPAFVAALARAMTDPANPTVGALWRAMQLELAQGEFEAIELVHTYNLLGDPGTRVPYRAALSAALDTTGRRYARVAAVTAEDVRLAAGTAGNSPTRRNESSGHAESVSPTSHGATCAAVPGSSSDLALGAVFALLAAARRRRRANCDACAS